MLNNENGSLISLLAIGNLGNSLGNSYYKKKVKNEGRPSLWVKPMYGIQPNMIFDRKNHVIQKQFAKMYGICNKGTSPKHLKKGMDFQRVDIENIFGPCHNKIGYRYTWSKDEEIIGDIQRLWMIVH